MRSKHSMVITAVAIAVCAVAASVALAGNQHIRRGHGTRLHAAREAVAAGQGIGAELRAAFAVTRKPISSTDTLGEADVAQVLASQGADVAQSHRVGMDSSRLAAWVVPGRDVVCVYAKWQGGARASSCANPAQAQDGFAAAFGGGDGGAPGIEPNATVIYGLVPDGVRSVTMTGPTGDQQRLAVHDNAYAVEVTKPEGDAKWTLTYTDSRGRQTKYAFMCGAC